MTRKSSATVRAKDRPAAPADPPARRTRVLPLVAAAGVALLWVTAMTGAQLAGGPLWAVNLMMLVPAGVTLALQHTDWPQTRRWLLVVLLAFVVDQRLLSLYLLVALTWALHRSWVSDRAPLRFHKEPTRDR